MPGVNVNNTHEAAMLLSCTGWLVLHRMLMNQGFTLRRSGLSTETKACLLIGASATIWTAAVLWDIFADRIAPYWSLQDVVRILEAPILVMILLVTWLLSWYDALTANGDRPMYMFNLGNTNGPFDWSSGLPQPVYLSIWFAISLLIVLPSLLALAQGSVLQGTLNLISCCVLFFNGGARNHYIHTTHRYSADMLRISLATSHHEGTAYILPSRGRGFDAVWTPKVANEHLEADNETMALFRNMRSGKWSHKEPLERIRSVVAKYQDRFRGDQSDIVLLARWLYQDNSQDPAMRQIDCMRAPNVHLIGRDLMYALCHAEYLVFMGQGRLPPELQAKIATLRLMTRSGLGLGDNDIQPIGFTPGFAGYKEAVEYVYGLFNQEVDDLALNFAGTSPPRNSPALGRDIESIDEYVADLWTLCLEHSESTFTALYMFTTVWFMELGNTNGFHIFPLRCRNRYGDWISEQILWRQAWYCGLIAQLVAVSPAFYVAFVIGYLQ